MRKHTPKFITLGLAVLAVGAFTLSASAQGGGDGECKGKRGFGKRGHGGPKLARIIEKNAEALGIDEATVQAATEIATNARAEGQAVHEQIRPLHEQMKAEMDSDTPDEATVLELVGQISALKSQAAALKAQTKLQFRALLTAEQWEEVKALKKARRGKRGKWGKRGKRGHRGERGGDADE